MYLINYSLFIRDTFPVNKNHITSREMTYMKWLGAANSNFPHKWQWGFCNMISHTGQIFQFIMLRCTSLDL